MQRYWPALIALGLLAGCGDDTPTNPDPPAPSVAPTPAPTPTPVPTPPPASVTGFWHSEARAWDFRLEQQGGTIKGELLGFKNVEFANPADPVLQVNGTVDAAGTVDFSTDAYALRFSGKMEAGGARMSGSLFDCVNVCRGYGEVLIRR